MSSVIHLDGVSKQFGNTVALDKATIQVPLGVVFALLGENGAGKTTSIRLMLGLERPDSGESRVLGLSSAREGIDIRRRIGYVPDSPTLYDWMTVQEVGWFTAGFYPAGFLPHYLDLARGFELPLERRIRNLSKGMRAKVSLALAMAHQPELLILDEPTSGLDTLVRRSFLESMVDVAASGRTVFLSSHQINEVERVADIVAIMHQGRILVCEPLEKMKARMEQWVITFAESPFNLPEINGEILLTESHQNQTRLTISEPTDDALWRLREHPGIAEIQVHVPSLEEIFIAYLQCDEPHESAPQETSSPSEEIID